MKPTTARLLLVIFLIAAIIGWMIASLTDILLGRLFPVPWPAAVLIWLLTIGMALWTMTVRPRLTGRAAPLDPVVAPRTSALALAGSRTGAAVAGWYCGLGLFLVPSLDTAAGSTYGWAALVIVLGGLALIPIALWLERLCRLPDDDADTGAGGHRRQSELGDTPDDADGAAAGS